MERAEDILIVARQITKLYEQFVDEIRKAHQLSYIEIAILIFLSSNPDQNTAKDIAKTHMLQKGNVSQGVEALIRRNYLQRTPDAVDRRRIHLSLTAQAIPLTEQIETQRTKLMQTIFDGFSADELAQYTTLNQRIQHSTKAALDGKKDEKE